MGSSISVTRRFKNLAKRSELLVRLYRPIKFLNITSGKDALDLFRNFRKTRLMLTVRPYTLMDYPPLMKLYELASYFEETDTSGSFVECGVCNGGSAAVIASAAKRNKNRHVWLYDSWEGFPETDERDITRDLKKAEKGGCLGFEDTVRKLLFNRLHLDSTRVHLVKGWFTETLPMKRIGPIALLHLDCDLYESVTFCLEELYDDVVKGGYIAIDDYYYYKGCKEAVDDFINSRHVNVNLIKHGYYGAHFQKE
jgi:O-methyltransferase